ncbi:MAG: M20/M25/M40 family metallo-hydrolase [Candidatus Eisenbacteria bacterium]|nr:M20/M25/M40 family metallo-hydrolase [Candidatus Eisenbacteria bacterium]
MPRRAALFTITLLLLGTFCSREKGKAMHEENHARIADHLIDEALRSDLAYAKLSHLSTRIGHRLCGSHALEEAITWAEETMRRDGLANVRSEPVMVPCWVRGEERAELLTPVRRELKILGLGMSVGTPPEGIEADVVAVESFDELERLGREEVEGKIVLYAVPYEGYGGTVDYRLHGASRAARLGAVAALVRSISPARHDTPHTGTLFYDDDSPRIPAAAVTVEDAERIRGAAARGEPVRARIAMGARLLGDAPSANVIGEVAGREKPEEIVLIGGHIDSWDVGQGAQDDGVGCVIAMEAARLIHRLGAPPRRTIRVVLFTNEENGTRGGKAYRDGHREELPLHVAAIESDAGNGLAAGFGLDLRVPGLEGEALERARARGVELLARIAPFLERLGAGDMRTGWSGVDIGPIVEAGVPGLGMRHDTSRYFDVHHSDADRIDRIDPEALRRNTAILAVTAYLLADFPESLAEIAAEERDGGS